MNIVRISSSGNDSSSIKVKKQKAAILNDLLKSTPLETPLNQQDLKLLKSDKNYLITSNRSYIYALVIDHINQHPETIIANLTLQDIKLTKGANVFAAKYFQQIHQALLNRDVQYLDKDYREPLREGVKSFVAKITAYLTQKQHDQKMAEKHKYDLINKIEEASKRLKNNREKQAALHQEKFNLLNENRELKRQIIDFELQTQDLDKLQVTLAQKVRALATTTEKAMTNHESSINAYTSFGEWQNTSLPFQERLLGDLHHLHSQCIAYRVKFQEAAEELALKGSLHSNFKYISSYLSSISDKLSQLTYSQLNQANSHSHSHLLQKINGKSPLITKRTGPRAVDQQPSTAQVHKLKLQQIEQNQQLIFEQVIKIFNKVLNTLTESCHGIKENEELFKLHQHDFENKKSPRKHLLAKLDELDSHLIQVCKQLDENEKSYEREIMHQTERENELRLISGSPFKA